MCSPDTLFGIRTGRFKRKCEVLEMDVTATAVCHGCDTTQKVAATVFVPCDVARRSNDDARKFVGQKLRHDLLMFGPISYQRFCEAVMETAASTDLKALAGDPFLLDMKPEGRA